jgi:hypothetical protein
VRAGRPGLATPRPFVRGLVRNLQSKLSADLPSPCGSLATRHSHAFDCIASSVVNQNGAKSFAATSRPNASQNGSGINGQAGRQNLMSALARWRSPELSLAEWQSRGLRSERTRSYAHHATQFRAWRNCDIQRCAAIAAGAGRTYSEGFSLRWSQVDFDYQVIRLDNKVKTPGSAEPIPLSQYACDVLQAWRRKSSPVGEYVFPSPVNPGRPISTVKTAWQATLRRAGVTAFPIYNRPGVSASSGRSGTAALEMVRLGAKSG